VIIKPSCFKNVWWHKAFCSYFYNKNAWMTMVIFETRHNLELDIEHKEEVQRVKID